MNRRTSKGYTLIEILVTMVIIGILATVGIAGFRAAKDHALCLKDVGQLRAIGGALNSRAVENNGYYYTKGEVGNSSFRAYTDRLSLCQVLLPWLESPGTWISPKPNPKLERYGNTYAWSRASSVTEKSTMNSGSAGAVILLWNAHTYTIPSVRGVTETGSSGGPRNAPKQYYFYPWKNGKAINWYYSDGHVETR